MRVASESIPVQGTKEEGAALHQWHSGMDAVYAVGSQWYAGRTAWLRTVQDARDILDAIPAAACGASNDHRLALVKMLDEKIANALNTRIVEEG